MGFPEPCIALPPGASEADINALCTQHTAALDAWVARERARLEAGEPAPLRLVTPYDGSVRAACRQYQEHPQSPFQTVAESTRGAYLDSLKILEGEVGGRQIRRLTVFDVKGWYAAFRAPVILIDEHGDETPGPERIKRAHDAIAMFRTVLWFNAALRRAECRQLAEELKAIKFERGGAREEELTYSQVTAFIRAAAELGRTGAMPWLRAHYMALGVAAQFECGVRQGDIIGKWTKRKANARFPSDQVVQHHDAETWAGYFTWERIPGWTWRMRTSKSKYRTGAEFVLSDCPLLFPLLEQVPLGDRAGAIVKGEHGLPVRYRSYANWFRQIARAANIPDAVWNMDARAGANTEALEAGASLDDARDSLTQTRATTTLRYVRRNAKAVARVREIRNAARAAEGGEDGA